MSDSPGTCLNDFFDVLWVYTYRASHQGGRTAEKHSSRPQKCRISPSSGLNSLGKPGRKNPKYAQTPFFFVLASFLCRGKSYAFVENTYLRQYVLLVGTKAFTRAKHEQGKTPSYLIQGSIITTTGSEGAKIGTK